MLLGLAVGVAACGERAAEVGSTGPASDGTVLVPATEAPATVTEATAIAEDVPTATAAGDEATDATSAPAATEATVDLDALVTTLPDGPLGGVTGLDPLPEQTDAATDPASAEAGVRYAYEHWLLLDLDRDVRGRVVENGEANVDELQERLEEVRSIIEFGRIHVQSVAFGDAEHATVTFRITWYDDPSPIFPNEMTGAAVFQDGTWRIATRTLCVLAFGIGTDCATSDTPPTPPAALRVTAIPARLEWAGSPDAAGVVNVNGMPGAWLAAASLEPTTLNIWVQVLIGISAVEGPDLDALLVQSRYAGPESIAIEDPGVRGRFVEEDGAVQVVVIRADDSVVRASAFGLTVDEVVRAVASMVPTEPVPEPDMGDDGQVIVVPATEAIG